MFQNSQTLQPFRTFVSPLDRCGDCRGEEDDKNLKLEVDDLTDEKVVLDFFGVNNFFTSCRNLVPASM